MMATELMEMGVVALVRCNKIYIVGTEFANIFTKNSVMMEIGRMAMVVQVHASLRTDIYAISGLFQLSVLCVEMEGEIQENNAMMVTEILMMDVIKNARWRKDGNALDLLVRHRTV